VWLCMFVCRHIHSCNTCLFSCSTCMPACPVLMSLASARITHAAVAICCSHVHSGTLRCCPSHKHTRTRVRVPPACRSLAARRSPLCATISWLGCQTCSYSTLRLLMLTCPGLQRVSGAHAYHASALVSVFGSPSCSARMRECSSPLPYVRTTCGTSHATHMHMQCATTTTRRDRHELVRRQALALLANLLMKDYVKWRGPLFHRRVQQQQQRRRLPGMLRCGPLLPACCSALVCMHVTSSPSLDSMIPHTPGSACHFYAHSDTHPHTQ
jgi:hypothetical protein